MDSFGESIIVERATSNTTDLPYGWVIDRDGRARPFWYSTTGMIIKWSVFWGIFILITLYLVIGTCHARSRLRKGKMPLRYHRFMVNRAELARIDPSYAPPMPMYYQYSAPQQYGAPAPPYYNMQPMAPPPTYQPAGKPGAEGYFAPPAGAPPVASPPAAAPIPPQTTGVTSDYAPPAGPPPPAAGRS